MDAEAQGPGRVSQCCVGRRDRQCGCGRDGKMQRIKGTQRGLESADPTLRGTVGRSIKSQPSIHAAIDMPDEEGGNSSSITA